ncbi:hypothetical protein [Armatimonas sp.]|uniref:hypothetical protein n=1 Tax=Armatimonas sp. TaxID=1872638 RepID=UPI003751D952
MNSSQLENISKILNVKILQTGFEIHNPDNNKININPNSNNSSIINEYCKKYRYEINKDKSALLILNPIRDPEHCDKLINLNVEDINHYCHRLLSVLPNFDNDSKDVPGIYFTSRFVQSLSSSEKQAAFTKGVSCNNLSNTSQKMLDKYLLYTYFGRIVGQCTDITTIFKSKHELKISKQDKILFLKYKNKNGEYKKRIIDLEGNNSSINYSFTSMSVADFFDKLKQISGENIIYPPDLINKGLSFYNIADCDVIRSVYSISRFFDLEVNKKSKTIVISRKKYAPTGDYINDIKNSTPIIIKREMPYFNRLNIVKSILDKYIIKPSKEIDFIELPMHIQCAIVNYISDDLIRNVSGLIISGMPYSWDIRQQLIFKIEYNPVKTLKYTIYLGENTNYGFKNHVKASMKHV